MQRLERFLSQSGQYSRREWKAILKAGRIQVNEKVVRDGSVQIEEHTDRVTLDAVPIAARRRIVLMMHKPAGYVTATKDHTSPTVMDLLPPEYGAQDVLPVGRLDKDTEGLLLFTNDGELLHRLISPRHGITKIYEADHEGTATAEDVQAFAQGLRLGDGTLCLPAQLEPLEPGKSRITVCEGKYHQVRRMMASRKMHVNYLKRISEGPLKLGDLSRGKVRELTENEIVTI